MVRLAAASEYIRLHHMTVTVVAQPGSTSVWPVTLSRNDKVHDLKSWFWIWLSLLDVSFSLVSILPSFHSNKVHDLFELNLVLLISDFHLFWFYTVFFFTQSLSYFKPALKWFQKLINFFCWVYMSLPLSEITTTKPKPKVKKTNISTIND